MIRLSIPTLDAKEEQAVRAVLRSGFLVQGNTVAQFEKAIADYLGVPNVVAVSSGTSALHLALLCLGVGPNDEVIIPDYTFPATANVVELCGAKPVIADIEADTYNIDPSRIERLITARTRVIMPVHLFGQSADMGPIMAIARRHKLHVVEDAACSLGALYKDRLSGTIGDVGCYSFHPRKVITTGEGGIIVTRKRSHADALRILRNHGIAATKKGVDFVLPGFNYRMTELHAAIGVVQMRRLSSLIEARRKVAREYDRQLRAIPWVTPVQTAPYNTHVYQTYAIRVDKSIDRDRFIRYLRDNGIESNFGTYAIHRLSFYKKKYRLGPSDFPVADSVFKTTVALPLFDHLTRRQIAAIAATIGKFR